MLEMDGKLAENARVSPDMKIPFEIVLTFYPVHCLAQFEKTTIFFDRPNLRVMESDFHTDYMTRGWYRLALVYK